MPNYSSVIIFYIIVQLISILLLLTLILFLLKSKPHFMKWTLFQFFIAAVGNGFSALPPIIMYGNELNIRAFETPVCIITNKIANFTLYPLELFPLVIAFYLWHVLVTHKLDIEKKSIWYVSILVWLYTIVYNTFEVLSSKKYENWGVRATILNCKTNYISINFYGYVIPSVIIIIITSIITCHSSIMLHSRWKNFNINMNRTTAIKLGHAVRLHILCVMIIVLMLLTLIPRMIFQFSNVFSPATVSSSFIASSVGIVTFLIFGTNTKAALFLPFCYYVPPDKPLIQEPASCIV